MATRTLIIFNEFNIMLAWIVFFITLACLQVSHSRALEGGQPGFGEMPVDARHG
jgi:hypothetical protein